MGRMKDLTEEMTNSTIHSGRNAMAKKKTNSMPTVGNAPINDTLPLSDLILQLRVRIRRTVLSFRRSFHNRTLGLFEHRGLLKVGIVGVAAYLVLFLDYEMPNSSNRKFTSKTEKSELDMSGGISKKLNWMTNDAAPISVGGLSEDQAKDYIQRYSATAIGEMEKFGIPASISLAQGLVESRGGLSTLAKKNNNHFGMKCFSKKCKKGHCSNHTDDTHKDFFKKYKSPWDSWREHSRMIASGRYAPLQNNGKNYRKWATGLKSLGYATDPQYAEKLIGMIERYELYRYDNN